MRSHIRFCGGFGRQYFSAARIFEEQQRIIQRPRRVILFVITDRRITVGSEDGVEVDAGRAMLGDVE